ncbi:CASP-like protein PIMP1 [Ipomoea triloba]|uniref:CASP-like protein PIMP1 n=1 Tax=Ipomoea triloba TaxID=35885 RepID=UPI00125CDFFE|nr:CASP-like protein PIMP1 [Ipomoea triloba]
MGSPVVSPLINLVVRVFTIIFILASLIVLATDNITYGLGFYDYGGYQIKSTDIYAYRYMISVMVIGLVWILIQCVFTILHFSSGNPIGGNAFAYIEFYGDKVISYLLGTGAAAGFGLTVDAKRYGGFGLTVDAKRSILDSYENYSSSLDSFENDFFNKANAAASLLLIAFLLSAISSVFSSYNLPKVVTDT